jgi:hypothetical protein
MNMQRLYITTIWQLGERLETIMDLSILLRETHYYQSPI